MAGSLRFGVLLSSWIVAALVVTACFPVEDKTEGSDLDGLLQTRCDPKRESCPTFDVAGCFDAEARGFCETYLDTGDAFSAAHRDAEDYDQGAMLRGGLNYPGGSLCATYYDSVCGDCPAWDLASCAEIPLEAIVGADPMEPVRGESSGNSAGEILRADRGALEREVTGGGAGVCVGVFQDTCTRIYESQCPTASPRACDAWVPQAPRPGIREEDAIVLGVTGAFDEGCGDWLLYQCSEVCADAYPDSRLDMDFCGDLAGQGINSGCRPFVESRCTARQAKLCEEAYPSTLDTCSDLTVVSPYCAEEVAARCTSMQTKICGESYDLSLNFCGDPAGIDPWCEDAVADLCAEVVARNCPPANAANCAYPDLAQPVCLEHLAEVCEGWQDEFCAGDYSLENCADSQSFYGLVGGLPDACADWAVDHCQDVLVAYAEAQRTAEENCVGTLVFVEGEGEDNTVSTEEGYSIPGRYDCVEPTIGTPTGIKAQWEADGNHISSCEEYAYKRFYTYNQFLTAIEPFKDDARLVFDVAFSDDPAYQDFAIGWRALNMDEPFVTYEGDAMGRSPAFSEFWYNYNPQYLDQEMPYGLHQVDRGPGAPSLTMKNDFRALMEDTIGHHVLTYRPAGASPDELALIDGLLDDISGTVGRKWDIRDDLSDHSGWAWQHSMDTNMRHHPAFAEPLPDAELQHFYGQRKKALGEIARMHVEYDLCRAEGGSNGTCDDEVVANNHATFDMLQGILIEAWANDCFVDYTETNSDNPYAPPGRCDWAPEDFMDALNREFGQAQENLIARCNELVTDDWDDLTHHYDYLQYLEPRDVVTEIGHGGDATLNLHTFEYYLDQRLASIALMPMFLEQMSDTLPEENQPTWGQSWSDGAEVGDRRYFAAGYRYGAGWRIDPPAGYPEVDASGNHGICDLNARADAYLDAYTFMFNKDFHLLDGQIQGNAQEQALDAHMKLFGFTIWSSEAEDDGGPDDPIGLEYEWSVAFSEEYGTDFENSRRIPIINVAGITVFLELGGAGSIGVDVNAEAFFAGSVQACDAGFHMGFNGALRPYASVSGFVEAGFDFLVVDIGVGGEMNLIDVELPIVLDVGARADTDDLALNAVLHADAQADFHLAGLRGETYYFVDYGFFGGKDKYTIHKSPGYTSNFHLFNRSYSMSLQLVYDYCVGGYGNCSADVLGAVEPVEGVDE